MGYTGNAKLGKCERRNGVAMACHTRAKGKEPENDPMRALIAALAACLLVTPALAQRAPESPVLQANGNGRVMVVPDIAIVTIGVTARGRAARDALDANSRDLAQVIAAVRVEGVADKDIATSGFSIHPLFADRKDGTPADEPAKIVGYQVSNQVRVTIREIESSGGILDKVVTAGANQVNGITFDIADRRAAEDAALQAAIAEARRQGAIMAAAAGVRLVRVVSVNGSAGGGGPVFARLEMKAMDVPVMPGERAVTANASITWEIAAE